jgi:hypothetical protein
MEPENKRIKRYLPELNPFHFKFLVKLATDLERLQSYLTA